MDDPTNTEAPATAAQAQGTAAPAQPSFFTKEDWAAERDRMFADMRKMVAGISKQTAKTQEPTPKTDKQETASPTTDAPLTRDELARTLQARDQFHAAASSYRLSESARARMLRDFERDRPEDVSSWVKAYATDFGFGQASESKPSAPRSAYPVSDGSAPAPVTTPSSEIEPWRLSEDDVLSQIRRKGRAAAGAEFRAQLRSSLNGRRLRLK